MCAGGGEVGTGHLLEAELGTGVKAASDTQHKQLGKVSLWVGIGPGEATWLKCRKGSG